MKYITLGAASLMLLAGCAGDYSFQSNLNSAAINDYFKAGDVSLYTRDQAPQGLFERLAMVSGESCQLNPNDPPASQAEARTQLRRHTADIGGNGVMLNNCVSFSNEADGCISRIQCIGQAIKVTQED
ncbi:Rcs stress response system protein RcsF [Shewanella sp. NIFS-20-20]|uniref:Rcs stress response system protein RcsF n=1 Tax=Shewanella sp. NIFS-20-20 TaxID=2853806 RepID=UPI001C4391DE|nr:Rcs stress response system protein RcsF [Shewanella sp. NIFS-20-20]MBV7316231.1 hypothetical protein [Shewanella sp. NIFS-20-20]